MRKWLKTEEHILFSVERRVARIALNRPAKRNAMTWDLLVELRDALLEADDLNAVSVIVLEGAGRDFCSGYDLTASYARYAEEERSGPTAYRSGVSTLDNDSWKLERTQQLMATIFDVHKPVIAKVQGNCLAGGTDLALWCDMVIAAEDARIGFPATRANGSPPNHMWFYLVGPQWAKRLLLSGDCLTGRDAARLGLVLDAVPAAELDAEVLGLAERIAHVDAELLAANKRIVNIALELGGARTLARMAAEMDARAHLSQGDMKRNFDRDIKEFGMREAALRRDAPFGDGMVRLRAAGRGA